MRRWYVGEGIEANIMSAYVVMKNGHSDDGNER